MIITLIGSRNTPDNILECMRYLVESLNKYNVLFRSGAADGADMIVSDYADSREIYIPWEGFNNSTEGIIPRFTDEHRNIIKRIHPASDRLSRGAWPLHMRNINQVIGMDIDNVEKSDLVVCWTKEGKSIGGTRTAITLAKELNVPVWNIGKEGEEETYTMISKMIKYFEKNKE